MPQVARVPVVFDSRHPYPTGFQARVPCLAGTRAWRVPTTGTRVTQYPCCTLDMGDTRKYQRVNSTRLSQETVQAHVIIQGITPCNTPNYDMCLNSFLT